MANANRILTETLITHLAQFKDKEKFKIAFENIFGIHDLTLKSKLMSKLIKKSKNLDWWYELVHDPKKKPKEIANDKDIQSEMITTAKILRQHILTHLRKAFDNEHIKIKDGTLKEFFKTKIVPEIMKDDKTKHSVGYMNLAKQKIFNPEAESDDSKILKKQWNAYLSEIANGMISIDELTMHALSDILNQDLTYTNQEKQEVTIKCKPRFNFVIKEDNHEFHVRQLGHGFSNYAEIKKLKDSSQHEVLNLDIKLTEGPIETQIANYIFSVNGKNDKIENALKAGKTIVLFVKTKKVIDCNKLQEALKVASANKKGQKKEEETISVTDLNQDHTPLTISSPVEIDRASPSLFQKFFKRNQVPLFSETKSPLLTAQDSNGNDQEETNDEINDSVETVAISVDNEVLISPTPEVTPSVQEDNVLTPNQHEASLAGLL